MWVASLGLSKSQERTGSSSFRNEWRWACGAWPSHLCEPLSTACPGAQRVAGVWAGSCGPLVPQGSLLSIHSMQVVEILSSKALCKIQVKWEYIKEDALVSAVSNMWYLQTINIFNGFNSYFLDFFVTFYSFWRPNCYITRNGSLWSYIDLLNLTKSLTELVTNSFVWTWK